MIGHIPHLSVNLCVDRPIGQEIARSDAGARYCCAAAPQLTGRRNDGAQPMERAYGLTAKRFAQLEACAIAFRPASEAKSAAPAMSISERRQSASSHGYCRVIEYTDRPHASLEGLTPIEFATRRQNTSGFSS